MRIRTFCVLAIATAVAVTGPAIEVDRDKAGFSKLEFNAPSAAAAQKRDKRKDRVKDRVEDRADERRRETRQQARRVARRTVRRVTRRQEYFNKLPSGCKSVVMNGYPYFYCGGVYYEEALDESDVTVYIIVNP